jgi:PIN domain nuclease of toxin-antitoxin system
MKYLLDTNICIWLATDSKRITKDLARILNNGELYTSVTTIWEIGIKESIGKIKLKKSIIEYLENLGIKFLDVNKHHADYVKNLPYIHKDPFDRIIIAQAKVDNMKIITSDEVFTQYSKNVILVE